VRPFLAVLRVTVSEAIRSRVAAALVLGLAAILLALSFGARGDGTEAGRLRAFLAAALDATWGLLALAAVFLSTTTLARELEDGRAIPIGVTPVSPLALLAGKCAGIVSVLGVVLALALAWTAGVVLLRVRDATPAGRATIRDELLVARAELDPPRVDASSPGVTESAVKRLQALKAENELPPEMSPEVALKKLIDDEVVRALSVAPGHEIGWDFEPQLPVKDSSAITLRFKYRTVPPLEPGQGPNGTFKLWASGFPLVEWPTRSSPEAHHEVTKEGSFLWSELAAPVTGKVTRVEPGSISVEGTPLAVPEDYKLLVSEGDAVTPQTPIARATRIRFRVTYENHDPRCAVIFRPEGVSLLYPDRALGANFVAAFGLLLGRLVFLAAAGLALSTFLEGRVAALATFFVLAVAAAHGFLDDAVGPVLASSMDNVFGPLDVPVKAILRAVLWILPDLGHHDAGEALAEGRVVTGALASLSSLGVFASGVALAVGSSVFGRRELAA
jgi:hypothetical protein